MPKAVDKQVLCARMRYGTGVHLHGGGRSRHQPDRRRPAGNGLLSGGVPAKWPMVEFLEQTVSLPSYLRREVTTAGGQGHHTMSYAIQLGEARYGGSP